MKALKFTPIKFTFFDGWTSAPFESGFVDASKIEFVTSTEYGRNGCQTGSIIHLEGGATVGAAETPARILEKLEALNAPAAPAPADEE